MLKLRLKFFYKDNGMRRLVITFASPPFPNGPYRSQTQVYTEDGVFEISKIQLPIEETLEEVNEKEE